ncbi:MAG TPA: hypothetical protein VI911_11970 [Patescibacteria group bacterium]|nr:hypothetical protein [Patescibacteria group bacterium]
MSNLKLDIDIESIVKDFKEVKKQVEAELVQGVQALASMTNARLYEVSRDGLKSLRKKYQDAIEFTNPEANLWIVSLKEEAMFIESGRKSGWMSELLNGKSAKTSKDGKKYAIIPFEMSKNPSEQTPKAQDLTNQIKAFLKQQGVSYKKIEHNQDGSPRLGLLHKFDIDSARPSPMAKDPALKGLSIYQHKMSDGSIKRQHMVFRIIHESHQSQGKWVHPGLEAKNFMDSVFSWACEQWEQTILPSILKDYK